MWTAFDNEWEQTITDALSVPKDGMTLTFINRRGMTKRFVYNSFTGFTQTDSQGRGFTRKQILSLLRRNKTKTGYRIEP